MEYSITIFTGPPGHHQGSGTMLSSSTSGDHRHSITLEADFAWRLSVHSHEIQPANCPALSELPTHLGISASVPIAFLAWNAHGLPWTP